MILLQIYHWVCHWKNFENRLTFGEVMGKSLVSCFLLTHGVEQQQHLTVQTSPPVAFIPFAANISAVTVMREMIRYIMWTMISHTKPNNIQAYHIVVRATATAGLRVTMQKNSSNLDTGFPDQRMYSRIDTNTYRQTDRQTHGHASLNTSVPSRRRSNQNL